MLSTFHPIEYLFLSRAGLITISSMKPGPKGISKVRCGSFSLRFALVSQRTIISQPLGKQKAVAKRLIKIRAVFNRVSKVNR